MNPWTEIQEHALTRVFEILNKNGIPWMIMRNYEGLPQRNPSKDVDMAIPKSYWKQAQQLIFKEMKETGFEYVLFTRFQSIWCHNFYRVDEDQVYIFKLDIFGGYEWRGAEYISFDRIYERSIRYNEISVPDEVDNALMLLLKPLILGGIVYDKYKGKILQVLDHQEKEFISALSEITGFREASVIVKALKEDDGTIWKTQQRIIRKKIWRKCFKRQPLKTMKNLLEHYWVETRRRILTRENRILAVLGPDGVGKTTFLELLTKEIGDLVVMDASHVETVHFRPGITPNLKKLIKRNYDESKEEFSVPHRAKPVNCVSSFIRLTYYWLDYVIGLPAIVSRARLKNQIIIFDRYFQDFLVDPYRARIKLPFSIRKAFFSLVYHPRITFILQTDAGIIYGRKQELELPEIERQLRIYDSLVDGIATVSVDAGQKPEKMVRDAMEALLIRFCKKI